MLGEFQPLPSGYPSNYPRTTLSFVRGRGRSDGEGVENHFKPIGDGVPRDCSTGQVFIAGSFVQIPLLINDYPNSMIDRQYRWLAALPHQSEFISYLTDDLIIRSPSARFIICCVLCAKDPWVFFWNSMRRSKFEWKKINVFAVKE